MNKEISKLPKEEADRVLELPNSYLEKGREEGREEGIKIGKAEVKKRLVLNMIKKGLSLDVIAEIAEMDVDEVKEIKEQ